MSGGAAARRAVPGAAHGRPPGAPSCCSALATETEPSSDDMFDVVSGSPVAQVAAVGAVNAPSAASPSLERFARRRSTGPAVNSAARSSKEVLTDSEGDDELVIKPRKKQKVLVKYREARALQSEV